MTANAASLVPASALLVLASASTCTRVLVLGILDYGAVLLAFR